MDDIEFNNKLDRIRKGGFLYSYEKTIEYIKTNRVFIAVVISLIIIVFFITYNIAKNGFDQAMTLACSGELAEKLDNDYSAIELNNIVL